MTKNGILPLAATLIACAGMAVSASQASAFCGFYVAGGDTKLYNDATQVVLMRDGNRTVLSMQNNYQGPAADFAMVVPVPQILQKENVRTLKKDVFDQVDQLSAPRLVEYWERDPCYSPAQGLADFGTIGFGGLGLRGAGRGGGGFGSGGYVNVEAKFAVGEYDIVILSTNDATALGNWLQQNEYKTPTGAEPLYKPYIESGSYFFVAKVNVERVAMQDGKAVLSPLRFHYESTEFSLPVRLGMINSSGKQDLLVYILGYGQRYEVANYPNVTIPTNVEVSPRVRDSFGEFYEALYARTVEENPKAVVTEYSWAAAKCDPCPSGLLGGQGLRPHVLATLGNDIIKKHQGWNAAGWTLTRLHARYAPDDIGEDLVFKKAEPIAGGREVYAQGKELEKGAQSSTAGNNFQGRYIIRNEWEGKVECEKPAHGVWGPPPDPHGMKLTADIVVDEMRRRAAAEQGREPTDEELTAPRTDAEREAIAFHLRRKYGTSQPPASAGGGPSTAPSANTRGAALSGGITLASTVREAIPEIKVTPAPQESPSPPPVATAPDARPPDDAGVAATPAAPAQAKENWPPGSARCSTTLHPKAAVGPGLLALVLGAAGLRRRRTDRRATEQPDPIG